MHHDRNRILFSNTVNRLKLFHPIEVIDGIEQLVRGVNFDHADPQPQDVFHIGTHVLTVARMDASAWNQPLWILFNVVGDELIDLGVEANHLGSNVVDENGSIDSDLVEMIQKLVRRTAKFNYLA